MHVTKEMWDAWCNYNSQAKIIVKAAASVVAFTFLYSYKNTPSYGYSIVWSVHFVFKSGSLYPKSYFSFI